jgi:hypothetical protein
MTYTITLPSGAVIEFTQSTLLDAIHFRGTVNGKSNASLDGGAVRINDDGRLEIASTSSFFGRADNAQITLTAETRPVADAMVAAYEADRDAIAARRAIVAKALDQVDADYARTMRRLHNERV